MDIILNDNVPSEPRSKRRWGMAGTESLRNGVEVMPRRSADDRGFYTWTGYSFD